MMRTLAADVSRRSGLVAGLLLTCLLAEQGAGAGEVAETVNESSELQLAVSFDLGSFWTSNVFQDQSREWDAVIRPNLDLELNLSDTTSFGYSVDASIYSQHADLFSQWHQLFFFYNPSWGDEDQNELMLEASVSTLRNQPAFAGFNNVQPSLKAKITLEATAWLRFQLWGEGAYKLFYDDRASDSLDSWAGGAATFTLPSRTTLTPRVVYGFRHYPQPATGDTRDAQLEGGVHLSQNLWASAGLQLDYAYVQTFGISALLDRMLHATQEQITYLGWDFLSSGHRGMIGFKQLLGEHTNAGVNVFFQERRFDGWEAQDALGVLTGEDRHDYRLVPTAYLNFAWTPGEGASRIVPKFGFNLEYNFVKQWSNHAWFETQAHLGFLSCWAAW